MKELISKLSPRHQITLQLLLIHLNKYLFLFIYFFFFFLFFNILNLIIIFVFRVAANSNENKMTASSLGAIFGQIILRPPADQVYKVSKQSVIVQFMIDNAQQLFV